jgi:RNA polymerase sigma factor (sigma-70 family)
LPDSFEHIPDSELLERYRADGDTSWLGILLERYTLLLFGVCMKYLKHEEQSKDAVQQVFLKALSEFPKYPIGNVGGWLYQVTRNLCFTMLKNRRYHEGDELIGNVVKDESVPLADLVRKDKEIDRLHEALGNLKEDQRRCVTAFYLEKKSYAEIAAITGYSIKQVKSHIQNGKRNLRLKLEERTSTGDAG